MTQPQPHDPACLLVGMLSAFETLFERAADAIAERFGRVSRQSTTLPFDFTDYYSAQMGAPLQRKFYSFAPPFEPERLAEVKLWTNELESRFAAPEFPVPRPINLDPGYLTPAKLVLASAKDHAHRIYLHSGIYAEVTLSYVDRQFRPMPWTYPDYRTAPYRQFFQAVRDDLVADRRKASEAP